MAKITPMGTLIPSDSVFGKRERTAKITPMGTLIPSDSVFGKRDLMAKIRLMGTCIKLLQCDVNRSHDG